MAACTASILYLNERQRFFVVFFLFSAGASDVANIARRHTQLRCEREPRQEEDEPLGFLPRTNAESNQVTAVV